MVSQFPEAARRSWRGIWRDDVTIYAAGIAFHSLAGIFAALFLFTTLLEHLGADPDFLIGLARFFTGTVPQEAVDFINTAVRVARQPIPGAVFPLAVLILLWMASNMFQTLIHSLNRIYHVEDTRSAWKTRLFAVSVVGVAGLSLLAAIFFLTLGDRVADASEDPNPIAGWISAAHEPLSMLAVALSALLIYWLAPNFRSGPRVVLPGAVVFTVTWLVSSYGFNLYLRELAVYDRVYGPVATAVVFLTWVYLSAFLLLVGGEFNASYREILVESTLAGEPGPGM